MKDKKPKGGTAVLTIKLSFGSDFQRLSMIGAFETAVKALKTFYETKHKDNSVSSDLQIKF